MVYFDARVDAQCLARLSKKGVVSDISSTIILVAESQIYNNFRGFGGFGPIEVAQTGNCRFCRNSSAPIEGIASFLDADLHEIGEMAGRQWVTNCHCFVRGMIF